MSAIEVAVILCAGVGSRLRPLTDDRPKALVDVAGKTILARAVERLAEAGVREIVVATGYRPDALERALSGSPLHVVFCHNPDYERTQNAVSLLLCERAVAGRSFFKLDGDVLFRPELLGRLSASRGDIVAAVERRTDLGAEEMKVLVGDDRRITAFGKHLDPKHAFGESIGIELVAARATRRLFDALSRARDSGEQHLYYEDIYGRLLGAGVDVRMVDVTDLAWTEIDTPEDLLVARGMVERGLLG
jgi:choline kinase